MTPRRCRNPDGIPADSWPSFTAVNQRSKAEEQMRKIGPGEECISAAEIVTRFARERGPELHATNAGNAAKALGLDYIEVEVDRPAATTWSKSERRYSLLDLPLIFEKLQKLADRRARFQQRDL